MADLSKLVLPVLNNGTITNQEFNLKGNGGGADDLNDLSDVTLSNPADGQILRYDATLGAWVNGGIASVSGETLTIG